MTIQHIAAFSDGDQGGNPAGVLISDVMPSEVEMQRIAKEVGHAETVFAIRTNGAWRVRYFSPAAEIPFCGHATIALGAALAQREGDGIFQLELNDGKISVEGRRDGNLFSASLQSPDTRSELVDEGALSQALSLLGLVDSDLMSGFRPARIHAGADHLAIGLASRARLASMNYDFDKLQALCRREGWVTVLLFYAETKQRFHARNAFPYGGLFEDPATGAAAAALAGHLRELDWPHSGAIEIHQGDDMGIPCRLHATIGSVPGASIRVSGTARIMRDQVARLHDR